MFCQECGNKNERGMKFCTSCGAKLESSVEAHSTHVTNNVSATNNTVDVNENKICTRLGIISLLLKYIPSFLVGIFSSVFSTIIRNVSDYPDDGVIAIAAILVVLVLVLGYIGSFITMIIMRVKYPKNVFGKVLMWWYIIELVISIIGFLVIFAGCYVCSANFF